MSNIYWAFGTGIVLNSLRVLSPITLQHPMGKLRHREAKQPAMVTQLESRGEGIPTRWADPRVLVPYQSTAQSLSPAARNVKAADS